MSILAAIDRAPVNPEEKTRLQQFTVFTILGLITMAFFGLGNLALGNYALCVMILLSGTGLAAGWVLLCHYPLGRVIYRVNALLFGGLLLYLLAMGGADGSKSLWMYTFPLVTFFLLGKKEGLLWTLGMLSLAMLLFLLPVPGWKVHPYSSEFSLRFATTYLIVSVVTFWFEYFREHYRAAMETERLRLQTALVEIHQTQQDLQAGQERFAEILSMSRDILYRRNLRDGSYDYISDAFCRHLGYSRQETDRMAFTGVEDLVHPDHRQHHQELIQALLAGEASALNNPVIEYAMRDKAGGYHWFSDHIALIHDVDGNPQSIMGSNREISAQRAAAAALSEAHQQLLTILDSIDAHVYVADMDTYEILYMNQKMREAFGSNLQGRICWREFRGEEAPCPHCKNAQLLNQTGAATGAVEWEGQNPITGSWYLNSDRAIRWVDNRWVKLQIAFDITHGKQLERERHEREAIFQQSQRLKAIGTLAGGIAHDFNNLLTAILGRVSLLEMDPKHDQALRNQLEQIRHVTEKAAELANRLTTFAAGGGPMKRSGSIAELLVKVASHCLPGKETLCEVSLPENLQPTAFDEDQMLLALDNLVANAFEAKSSHVALSAENACIGAKDAGLPLPTGQYILISVQDNGCGIPPENLGRVFDPYFTTKEKGAIKGMGLGLAITHSIVTRHNGHIQVQSEVGRGTLACIYLPAHDRP